MSQESYLDERGRSWTRDEMRAMFATPPSTELGLNTYQQSLHTYKDRHHECHALGLSGEVGEVLSELRDARDAAIAAGNVADMVKKATAHGVPLDRAKLKKELGDVLWYITAVASDNKLTLQEIAEANVAKLRERYPEGFVKGGGVREFTPCKVPPAGWRCTREGGHDGPCAAIPVVNNKPISVPSTGLRLATVDVAAAGVVLTNSRLRTPLPLGPGSPHRHVAHAVHFSCGCAETTVDGILHRQYCPNGECRRLGR